MRTKLRQNITGLLFLLPAVVLFAVFVVYPIVYNMQASTLDWDGVNAGTFVGFDNYVKLFQDPTFLIALRNSAYWIPLTIIPQALIGFLLALALNRGLFASTVYRAIFFIPAILSPVVVGIVWQRIMDPFNGVFTSVGKATGLDWLGGNFLANPQTAIFAVIFVNIWMWTGFSMLFYLAGLQLIDTSVLEAAKIDGAGPLQTTARIIFPLLKSTHLSLLLLGIIGSLKTFELVYVLTQGGPAHASEMLPTYAFQQAFQLQSVGYASTISVVLIVIAVASSLSMVRVFGAGFISGDEK
ncbi:MAG: sugar transporter permease [Rhodoglobus sp.]|jgi:ABC-type sugar transport system permease subunit|nr:sugar transporter permease [Rhodoglobus sp.]